MDKAQIVKCLRIANDLWAIEGANPYSVRAHAEAADTIWQSDLTIEEILALPPSTLYGVGRETLAMIQTLQEGGMEALLQRLNITIPVQAANLVSLPGIGPKTAHTLVHAHGITSAKALDDALREGRIQRIAGFGANKLDRLRRELRVFLERQHAVPIAMAAPFAEQFSERLRTVQGVQRVSVTGDVRRFCVMSPVVAFAVATQEPDAVIYALSGFERISSTDNPIEFLVPAPSHPINVRVHIASPSLYPLVLMETTGDETHQAVVSGLLQQNGVRWTPAGLAHESGNSVPVTDEGDIYAQVGLPFLPPEIREGNGILRNPANLVTRADIRGDLHVHSNWSDGSLTIREIVQHAERLGYEYVAITDHSQSLTIANGLTPERLMQRKAQIDEIQRHTKVHILHGIEVDILSDGRLDLPDETLLALDLVIASVHSTMQQSRVQMTERIVRAIRHPAVHIIGHLSGRIIGRRSAYNLDPDTLFSEALAHHVMFELNANPNRLDSSEELLRKAVEQAMLIPINTDTHHPQEFDSMAYGIRMAHRGWLYKENVLNTLGYEALMKRLRQRRSRMGLRSAKGR